MRGIRGYLFYAGLLFFIASCGSNGGGNSVSAGTGAGGGTVAGVAASGSELIGYAFLKDSVGAALGPQSIGPDGGFSFDVSGMTPPFYLRADGNAGGMAVKLHSFAVGPGTTHINPLTNIAFASAAGENNPALVYNNPSLYAVTQAGLDAATGNLRGMLMPLLVAYDCDINPFTGAYAANHTGLDGLLDVVSVELDTTAGTVTVLNRATGALIGAASVTDLANPTNTIVTAEAPSTALLDDLLEIKTMLASFFAALNKGTALASSDIDSFYAAAYGINDGVDRTLTINKEVSTPVTENKTITTIVGLNISPAGGGDYRVTGAFLFSDGSLYFPDEGYIVTKEGGAWKFKGNGFKSAPDIVSASYRWKNSDFSVQTESGLRLRIKDPGGYGFKTAVITGPGLPVSGITLADVCGAAVLCIEAAARNNTGSTDGDRFYLLSGAAIDAMPDNAEYTVNIYDATPSLLETRTILLQKPPFRNSELSLEGYFPKRAGEPTHDIAEANIGAPFIFPYALPSAYRVAWFGAGLNFWDGTGNSASYSENNLSFTAGTANIVSAAPAWTPMGAALYLRAKGVFRRETVLVWMFQ